MIGVSPLGAVAKGSVIRAVVRIQVRRVSSCAVARSGVPRGHEVPCRLFFRQPCGFCLLPEEGGNHGDGDPCHDDARFVPEAVRDE